mmetsp:Transcript_124833/g.296222  ORF Transcript_124833/g.296222 Transcript_124833/m.296222 type:complete len:253 (+) Transcript_124833:1206-1964(+)
MPRAVGAEDHRGVAPPVREGQVRIVDGRQAPIPELYKAVTEVPVVSEDRASAEGRFVDGLTSPGVGQAAAQREVVAWARVQGAIGSVDLNAVPVHMCHTEMHTVVIAQSEGPDLDEAISEGDAFRLGHWAVPGVVVLAWARVQGAIRAEDLLRPAALVRDGEVGTVVRAEPEAADLNELEPEGHPRRGPDWPAPGVEVGPWPRVHRAIVPEDLLRLAVPVADGQVVVVDGSDAEVTQLDEAIAHGQIIAGGC